jgi:hypothetical protein
MLTVGNEFDRKPGDVAHGKDDSRNKRADLEQRLSIQGVYDAHGSASACQYMPMAIKINPTRSVAFSTGVDNIYLRSSL